ncbi:MAG: MarR family transcriptional regulator [Chloroflexota bacterium]|nr:MarR family transcriptional regulator [Chloroflexota bacterium]
MARKMMAGVDTPQVEAFREVMRAEDVLRRLLDRELREERGISLSEYVVLLTLRYAPGGSLPVGALCAEVQLTRSGVTRLVDRMEAAGTVERIAAPADRRTVRAAITAHGRDVLREAWPVHRRGIDEHFSANLSDAEAQTLRDLLRRVVPEPG